MRIWTITDVTDAYIRTSVHGSEEDAFYGLREFIKANSEGYTEEELAEMNYGELSNMSYSELLDLAALIMPDPARHGVSRLAANR